MKYRLSMAMLLGAGCISLVALLLNLPGPWSLFISVLLLPGALLLSPFSRFELTGSAPVLLVLVANALVYSGLSLPFVAIWFRRVPLVSFRARMRTLAVPIAVLVLLACVPGVSPLWPRGMGALERKEKELQDAIPLSTSLEQVRQILLLKGMEFSQEATINGGMPQRWNDLKIVVAPTDLVLSTRLQTDATEFPCSYYIEAVFIFGQDGRLIQRYVHHPALCP